MNDSIKRIPSLDGLRAVSVLLVVFSHLVGPLPYNIENAVGNLGVRVFFVISGFLITSILVAEVEKTSTLSLTKFYFRRTLRIFPAYYFYLAAVFLASAAGIVQIPPESFFSSLTYTSNYIEPGVWELGHSWSLSVEEQFYLLFPGLILLCGLARTKKCLIFIVLLTPFIRVVNFLILESYVGFEIPVWYVFGFHTNMDALAVGCLLAVYRKQLHDNEQYKNFLRSPAAFCFIPLTIAAIVYNYSYNIIYFGFGITLLNLLIGSLIDWVTVNCSSAAGKILNSKIFVSVGLVSYSIYLWQQPFSKYDAEKWWTHFPYNIILLTAFSLLSYFLIEKKSLYLRQILENKLFNSNSKNLKVQNELSRKTV
jgi:peptidoglycan/LPS O-acetylase OafA/YrhL